MSKPVRLYKQEPDVFLHFLNKLDDWALRHAHIILPLLILIGLVLFVDLCFVVCGVSAVESGGLRNFIARGV